MLNFPVNPHKVHFHAQKRLKFTKLLKNIEVNSKIQQN